MWIVIKKPFPTAVSKKQDVRSLNIQNKFLKDLKSIIGLFDAEIRLCFSKELLRKPFS